MQIPLTSALRRIRQEDHREFETSLCYTEFQASLDYTVLPCLNKHTNKQLIQSSTQQENKCCNSETHKIVHSDAIFRIFISCFSFWDSLEMLSTFCHGGRLHVYSHLNPGRKSPATKEFILPSVRWTTKTVTIWENLCSSFQSAGSSKCTEITACLS